MSTVGTAYVVVRAISPSLEKDISKSVGDAVDKASPAISKASAKAGKAASKSLNEEFVKLSQEIGERTGDGVNRGFARRIGSSLSRTVRRTVSTIKAKKEGEGAGTKIARSIANGIDKFKIPPLFWIGFLSIPALSGALKIIGSYIAGAISLVGAIAPAFAAAGAAAVSSMFVLAGAAGAVFAALKTQTPQLEAFKKRIQGIAKEFRPIGIAAQKQLLPPLEKAFGTLTKTIPVLKPALAGLAAEVGKVAIELSRTVTSSTNLANLNAILTTGRPQISAYGGALSSIVSILLTIGAAATPIANKFAKFVEQFAAGAAAATAAGAASGRLSAFLERAGQVAAQLGQIFGDTFRGLFNLFSASSDSGQILLDRISALAAKFADWSGSLQGQGQLRAFFNNALPVIHEVNGLIGDLLKLIVKPLASGNTGGVIEFVKAMRADIVPALSEVGTAAAAMGPSLTNLAVSFAGLIKSMADSGALGAFTSTLATLFDLISKLFATPVVGQAVAWAVSFAGMAKAVSLVLAPIGGLRTVINILFPIFRIFGSVLMSIGRVVIPLLIGGIRALGVAFMANPIGFIVGLVALLVTGLVLAYQKSETFRNIVNKLGRAIMDGLGAALQWLKGLWDKVWPALETGWEAIKSAFSTGVNFVKGVFSSIAGFISSVWDKITAAFQVGVDIVKKVLAIFGKIVSVITQPFQGVVQFFQGVWQLITGIFTGNMDKITSGIANMVGGAVRFFLGMPARILGAVVGLVQTVGPAILGFVQQLGTWFMQGVDAVVGFFVALPGRIIAGVSALASMIGQWAVSVATTAWNNIVTNFNIIVDFMTKLPGRILDGVNSLVANLRQWAINTWNNVRTAFTNGVAAVIAFAVALPGRILNAVNSLVASLRQWAVNTWINVRTAFTNGITTIINYAKDLPGRIVTAVGNLGSRLAQAGRDLIRGFKDGIVGAFTGLLKTAKELAGKVVGAVKNALGIKSPSRVFMAIGKNVGQGFIEGIKGSQGAVEGQMGKLTDGMVSAGTKGTAAYTKAVEKGLLEHTKRRDQILSKIGTGTSKAVAASAVASISRQTGSAATPRLRSGVAVPVPAAGPAAAGNLIIETMTISVDDLDKMTKVGDWVEKVGGARVTNRMTARSGTVTA